MMLQWQLKGLVDLEAVENKELVISTDVECWECGDGCCTEWYDQIKINGEYVGEVVCGEYYEALRMILEHLGYSVTFE